MGPGLNVFIFLKRTEGLFVFPRKLAVRKAVSFVTFSTYVCTDSFHFTVLSLIYKRNFTTFRKFSSNDGVSKNNRITLLLHFMFSIIYLHVYIIICYYILQYSIYNANVPVCPLGQPPSNSRRMPFYGNVLLARQIGGPLVRKEVLYDDQSQV